MNSGSDNPGESIEFENRVTRIIEEALFEDIGMGDLTTHAVVPPGLQGTAEIVAKEGGVIAGIDVARLVFISVDPLIAFDPLIVDGTEVEPGKTIATAHGPVIGLLQAERTALNFLQRMSGIATATRKYVEAVSGTAAKITDTRKTAPGLRILDKRAVMIGGGVNHRFGLDDMILIKDNHIAAAGGLSKAVEGCLEHLRGRSFRVKIEVETRTLEEVREAAGLKGIDRVMLDNFPIADLKRAVSIINHAVEVEASGKVTLATVRAIAESGVDYISIGALTHSVKALDIAMNILQARS